MLKKLLSSCLDAYRGSHKSVVAGRFIATDLSLPKGRNDSLVHMD